LKPKNKTLNSLTSLFYEPSPKGHFYGVGRALVLGVVLLLWDFMLIAFYAFRGLFLVDREVEIEFGALSCFFIESK
jgi:hypothetical protein